MNSSVSTQDPLPIAMRARIEKIAGVERVNERAMFMGTYQRPDAGGAHHGDAHRGFLLGHRRDARVEGGDRGDRDRRGRRAIVGRFAMDQFGWKVGDRIVLQTPMARQDGSRDWTFDIVGVFDIPVRPRDARFLVANYDYVNEARLINRDTADLFVVKIADPSEGRPSRSPSTMRLPIRPTKRARSRKRIC